MQPQLHRHMSRRVRGLQPPKLNKAIFLAIAKFRGQQPGAKKNKK